MTDDTYDLAIAYRIYPGVSGCPLVSVDNKYMLADLCLSSFKSSLGSLRPKVWVILDNCPLEYERLFTQYFPATDLEFIHLEGIGNARTLEVQIKVLSEQKLSEIVYFAEDDYFYLPGKFEEMVNFIKSNQDVDFISPYDHLDYYTYDLHNQTSYIKVFGNSHWRTANATCHTFLTTKTNLLKTRHIFMQYATKGLYDAPSWISLTKGKIFNIIAIYSFYKNKDKWLFDIVKKAWFHNWPQVLFGKKWKLWVPIPSIATHLESKYLAPNIDWLTLIEEKMKTKELN